MVSKMSFLNAGSFLLITAVALSIELHANQPDNSKVNQRGYSQTELTAQDQGHSKQDIDLTQKIRQQVVKHSEFSTDAKNIKIISLNGIVTLKGPVKSTKEKNEIEKIATKIAGTSKVMSQIEVKIE